MGRRQGGETSLEYVGRREECKRRMLMTLIVPVEEFLAPASTKSGRRKALGVVGLILERLELRLREGVVVADVRAAEATHDPEGAEELREPLRAHGGAAVGVHDERTGLDAVARYRLYTETSPENAR